jgi:hypothetical protein
MSRGGYNASEHYPVPQHSQAPHHGRYYHSRPVTSDWDLQNPFQEARAAPFQQQNVRSPEAISDVAADSMHPHHARAAGHQVHHYFARDEANHSAPARGSDLYRPNPQQIHRLPALI